MNHVPREPQSISTLLSPVIRRVCRLPEQMDNAYETTYNDGGRGFEYENKLAALVALRLFNKPGDFLLASDCKKAGKFDDLVFAAENHGQWTTHFVQIKHTQKKITIGNLRNRSGEFALIKYYLSYKEIASTNLDPVFGHPVTQAQFFLFTNAAFHDEVKCRDYKHEPFELLSTNTGSELNVILEAQGISSDLVERFKYESACNNFLSKLRICTQQGSLADLNALIRSELGKIAVKSENDLELLSYRWIAYVHQWAPSGRFLQREDVQAQINYLSPVKGVIERKPVVKFTDAFITFISKSLSKGNLHVLVSTGVESLVMCKSVLQQISQPIVCISITDFLESHLPVLRGANTLVLECDGEITDLSVQDIRDRVHELISVNSKTRILIISRDKSLILGTLLASLGVKSRKFNCSMKDLSPETKEMLLEKQVSFQGYNTVLRTIMPASKILDDVYTMPVMTQMIEGKPVNVGVEVIEDVPYYVTRVLTREEFISTEECLRQMRMRGQFFLFTGVSSEEADLLFSRRKCEDLRFMVLSSEQEFDKIAAVMEEPLHLLKRSRNLWQWVRSSKNAFHSLSSIVIRKFFHFLPTEDIMDLKEKIMIVTAEPGMGKSTLISHVAADIKRRSPQIWVVRVVLNDFSHIFDSPNFFKNVGAKTKELIAAAAGVNQESKFVTRLFDYFYSSSGNMIVLLDGFDEIVPSFTEQGLAFIRALEKSAVRKVLVTGRPLVREMLETSCCTLAYSIKPFSKKDQARFLSMFWSPKQWASEKEKLTTFITRVQDYIRSSFHEQLEQFTGIPLQTLMIAQVFQEEWNLFKTGKTTSFQKINLVQLFQKFTEIKWKIYLEKGKIGETSSEIFRAQRQKWQEDWKEHMAQLSVLTLLGEKCTSVMPFLTRKERIKLKESINSEGDKSGMVVSFTNDFPKFIHRTFAEFFLAVYLKDHIAEPPVKQFFESMLFSPSFQFVLVVFNYLLAEESPLHLMVLDQNLEAVEKESCKTGAVKLCDAGGRTPLHLASMIPGSGLLITMLVDAGFEINAKDKILSWRPLDYALKMKDLENIMILHGEDPGSGPLPTHYIPNTFEMLKVLLKFDSESFLLLQQQICEVEKLDCLSTQTWLGDTPESKLTILHVAAGYNAVKILKFLLDGKNSLRNLIEKRNSDEETPLLVAARFGNSRAIQVLLKAGANPNAKGTKGKTFVQITLEGKSMGNSLIDFIAVHNPALANEVLLGLIGNKTEWAVRKLRYFLTLVKVKNPNPFLCIAARKGNTVGVQLLIEDGADVNAKNDRNCSALHLAVVGNHKETVDYLLKIPGIKLNIVDNQGLTPLFRAAEYEHGDIFQSLVSHGADIHFKMADGCHLADYIAKVRQSKEVAPEKDEKTGNVSRGRGQQFRGGRANRRIGNRGRSRSRNRDAFKKREDIGRRGGQNNNNNRGRGNNHINRSPNKIGQGTANNLQTVSKPGSVASGFNPITPQVVSRDGFKHGLLASGVSPARQPITSGTASSSNGARGSGVQPAKKETSRSVPVQPSASSRDLQPVKRIAPLSPWQQPPAGLAPVRQQIVRDYVPPIRDWESISRNRQPTEVRRIVPLPTWQQPPAGLAPVRQQIVRDYVPTIRDWESINRNRQPTEVVVDNEALVSRSSSGSSSSGRRCCCCILM